jgi:hypothetical protein
MKGLQIRNGNLYQLGKGGTEINVKTPWRNKLIAAKRNGKHKRSPVKQLAKKYNQY